MNFPRLPRRDVMVWLLLGLAVREAFSFWTGHPFDSEIWIRNAYYVAHGWNPYSYMPPVPGLSFSYTASVLPSVAYLPLWSMLLAGLYQLYSVFPAGGRFLFYFLLKQPPILGDVLLGALIFIAASRWGLERRAARRLLAFWMLFPYPILISAIWGQFDSLVAALVLGSLLAAVPWKRSGLLGLAVLLKTIPVIFVPYEFLRTKGRARGSTLLAVAIPVLFTAATFVAMGWGPGGLPDTISYETHSTPQGMTIGALLIDPALAPFVNANLAWITYLGYAWIPAVLVGAWWILRRIAPDTPASIVQAFLFLTVLLLLFRWVVNEQYLLYLLPLLLLDAAIWHPERRGLFHATWILGLAFLIMNNVLLVRFAAPVYPNAMVIEANLLADPIFGPLRIRVLEILGILFTLHLVQLGMVIANPRRSPSPWLALVLRRVWSASVGRVRSVATGRGG